jgi:glc operon protein GlcG
MDYLTMDRYQAMLEWIIDTVKSDGGSPVAISICDPAGSLVALIKMDGVPSRSVNLSQHKAYTAARMQTTTEAFMERLHKEKIEIAYFCDPKLTPFPGGAPIKALDGSIIGAVGISGRASAEDQRLANYAAGLPGSLPD